MSGRHYVFPGLADFVSRAQVAPECSGVFLGRANPFRVAADHAARASESLAASDGKSALEQLEEAKRWLDAIRSGASIVEAAIAEVEAEFSGAIAPKVKDQDQGEAEEEAEEESEAEEDLEPEPEEREDLEPEPKKRGRPKKTRA